LLSCQCHVNKKAAPIAEGGELVGSVKVIQLTGAAHWQSNNIQAAFCVRVCRGVLFVHRLKGMSKRADLLIAEQAAPA
jgi:hypothetical protein